MELAIGLACLALIFLGVGWAILRTEVGPSERICMKFDGSHWCIFTDRSEQNTSGMKFQLAGPAFRILTGDPNIIKPKPMYKLEFIFKSPRLARRRYKKITEVVNNYFTEHYGVFNIHTSTYVKDDTITVELRRKVDGDLQIRD